MEDRGRSVELLLAGSFPCFFILATRESEASSAPSLPSPVTPVAIKTSSIEMCLSRNTPKSTPYSDGTVSESAYEFWLPSSLLQSSLPRITNRPHLLNIHRRICFLPPIQHVLCPSCRYPVSAPLQTPQVSWEVSLYEQFPCTPSEYGKTRALYHDPEPLLGFNASSLSSKLVQYS
jgi:hypothetical protein